MTDGFDPDTEIAQRLEGRSRGMTLAQLRASPDCVKIIAPDGRIEFMSRNGMCAMEIENHSAIAGQVWWTLWPDAAQGRIKTAVSRALEGRTDRFEAECPTAKGTPKRWSVQVKPILGGSGAVDMILSSSREVPVPEARPIRG